MRELQHKFYAQPNIFYADSVCSVCEVSHVWKEVSNEKTVEPRKRIDGMELNLKKQYRRAFIAAQNREDWRIVEERNLPKGVQNVDSVYFYLELDPGIFQLTANELTKFMCQDEKINFKGGQSDHYGSAKTKNIYNFYFKIGGENLTMQIQFYTTKNVVDVKMTGNNAMKAAKHPEFGLKMVQIILLMKLCQSLLTTCITMRMYRE